MKLYFWVESLWKCGMYFRLIFYKYLGMGLVIGKLMVVFGERLFFVEMKEVDEFVFFWFLDY